MRYCTSGRNNRSEGIIYFMSFNEAIEMGEGWKYVIFWLKSLEKTGVRTMGGNFTQLITKILFESRGIVLKGGVPV